MPDYSQGLRGAYDVMNSKHIGSDFNYAWPSAEIAVMGAWCKRDHFKKEIESADDPAAALLEKEREYATNLQTLIMQPHGDLLTRLLNHLKPGSN